MNIVNHYDNTLSLKEKVLYMLSIHEGLLKMQTEKDKQIRYFLKAD